MYLVYELNINNNTVTVTDTGSQCSRTMVLGPNDTRK